MGSGSERWIRWLRVKPGWKWIEPCVRVGIVWTLYSSCVVSLIVFVDCEREV